MKIASIGILPTSVRFVSCISLLGGAPSYLSPSDTAFSCANSATALLTLPRSFQKSPKLPKYSVRHLPRYPYFAKISPISLLTVLLRHAFGEPRRPRPGHKVTLALYRTLRGPSQITWIL